MVRWRCQWPNPDCNPKCNVYSNFYSDCYGYRNVYADSNSNGNIHSDSYRNGNIHSDPYGYTFCDRNCNGNPNGNPNGNSKSNRRTRVTNTEKETRETITMRTIKYRDVMWSCAYRLGLNPATELLADQADALASYINAWVRRLYDSQDWPEWTKIIGFPVETTTRLAPYTLHLDTLTSGGQTETIGRVFGVYLLDPRQTYESFGIPFRLTPDGIWCGFDCGESVFIKYIPECPQFTSTPWDSGVVYNKGDVVYVPTIGECYKSRISNNLGHDPSFQLVPVPPPLESPNAPPPTPLVVETIQAFERSNPGQPAQPEILVINYAVVDIDPPPPPVPIAGTEFYTGIFDSAGVVLAETNVVADGTQTMANIIANTAANLLGYPLPITFSISFDTTSLTVTSESLFTAYAQYIHTGASYKLRKFGINQIQPYIPLITGSSGTPAVPQVDKVTLTDEQVISNSVYSIRMVDSLGGEHVASYTALDTDSTIQVLTGLANAISGNLDTFFLDITTIIDTTNLTISVATNANVSLGADMAAAGPIYWDVVYLPFKLADAIIRGEMADALREEGQTDRADGEEKKVETELGVSTEKFVAPGFLTLTDQQKPKKRYSIG